MALDEVSAAIVAEWGEPFTRIGIEVTDAAEARRLTAIDPELLQDPVEVGAVEDRTIPSDTSRDIPVRIYRPLHETASPPPLMVFCHGGGWVLGDLDGHDAICRELANRAGVVVLSVDYRLAPEHKFPAPVEDVYASLVWAAANTDALRVDPSRVVIAGDSAGGNLAAAATLMSRDRGGPHIAFQLLVYPVLDADFSRPSYKDNAEGFLLTARNMHWFWDQYADPAVRANPYVSPLRAADLSGLPRAHIVLGEHDVLRDEGEEYAARLLAAGTPVTVRTYPGGFHGFFGFGAVVPVARKAFADAVRELRVGLGLLEA